MYSDRFFKENDAMKEFMNLCIQEYSMIPKLSSVGYKKILKLSGGGVSIGLSISNNPICIEIVFIEVNNVLIDDYENVLQYYNIIELLIKKLIECANMYNVVIGAWIEDIDECIYSKLGFKTIEKSSKIWVEYSQLLN